MLTSRYPPDMGILGVAFASVNRTVTTPIAVTAPGAILQLYDESPRGSSSSHSPCVVVLVTRCGLHR